MRNAVLWILWFMVLALALIGAWNMALPPLRVSAICGVGIFWIMFTMVRLADWRE